MSDHLRTSNRHVHGNFRVAFVTLNGKIGELERVDVTHVGVDFERRECIGFALNLLFQRLHVVAERYSEESNAQGMSATQPQQEGIEAMPRFARLHTYTNVCSCTYVHTCNRYTKYTHANTRAHARTSAHMLGFIPVNVCVAHRMNEIARFQVAAVRDEACQERI